MKRIKTAAAQYYVTYGSFKKILPPQALTFLKCLLDRPDRETPKKYGQKNN